MSRGVVIFAHNNSEIDYLKIACANSLLVKKNLNVPVTLITDSGTIGWGKTALGEDFLKECFENIIEVDRDYSLENPRNYNDTSYSSKVLQFYNFNHWQVYDLTPYEETLFIDADYLILSNQLNNCWGSVNDFMADNRIFNLSESRPYIKNIDEMGIKQYWATVIYFKKTEFSQYVFTLMSHIQDNYTYYKELYCLQNSMFRNDNALSIAIHILNGYNESSNSVIGKLPVKGLLMSCDVDDIYDVINEKEIIMYNEKKDTRGLYQLVKVKEIDLHVMNKWSINRFSDKIIDLCRKKENV